MAPSSAQTTASTIDADRILSAVRNAGIVGMGGAGFPTHVKLAAQADTVLANGAECEPLLWSDKQTLLRWSDEVVAGVELVMAAVGAERGVIGVKAKYTEVVAAVRKAIGARGPEAPLVELYELRNFYPAGDEFSLVQQVLGRTIPEQGLPLHVGVVVSNVGTLQAVARAVRSAEPLTARLVSVVGEVREPVVVEAPVGTPVRALLEAAGGVTRDDVEIIDGGPMMGRLVEPDDPVMKTTSGLVVLPGNHRLIRNKHESPLAKLRLARAVCCSCMECTEVCPRNALGHRIYPHRLMQSAASALTHDTEAYLGALLCCECGLCTVFGCPLYLDPCQMNIEIKKQLREQGVSYPDPRATEPNRFFEVKQVPVSRLVAKLEITRYLRPLELASTPVAADRVRLLLQQGVGQASRAVVSKGDRVKRGQLVAEPGGKISAALHASIDGVVEQADETAVVIGSKA